VHKIVIIYIINSSTTTEGNQNTMVMYNNIVILVSHLTLIHAEQTTWLPRNVQVKRIQNIYTEELRRLK